MNNSVEKNNYKYFSYGKNVNLREVEVSDAQFILDLRCDEKLGRYINKTEYDLEKQIKYIENYKKMKNEYYFVVESKEGEPLGVLRFHDIIEELKSFHPGSWIIKKDAPVTTAIESALNAYEIAFCALGFERVHLSVRKGNIKVHSFHRRCGCDLVAENEIDYFFHFHKKDFPKLKKKFSRFAHIKLAEIKSHFSEESVNTSLC